MLGTVIAHAVNSSAIPVASFKFVNFLSAFFSYFGWITEAFKMFNKDGYRPSVCIQNKPLELNHAKLSMLLTVFC